MRDAFRRLLVVGSIVVASGVGWRAAMDRIDMDEPDVAVTKTDWARLWSMTDEEITRAVADDPDATVIPTEEELRQYRPVPARSAG